MTPKSKKYFRISGIILAILLGLLLIVWIAWLAYPMSDEELKKTDTTLITTTRYVISADSVDILAFDSTRGDTLLNNIVDASQKVTKQDVVLAQWVRRYTLSPYWVGALAIEPYDTAIVCQYASDKVVKLIKKQLDWIALTLQTMQGQRADVDYYIKTHTVTDNGFDMVARYSTALAHAKDSISNCAALLNKALQGRKLRIYVDRRYFLRSYNGLVECKPLSVKDGVQMIEVDTLFSHSRLTAKSAKQRVDARKAKLPKKITSAIDSLGTYTGERDSIAQPHGYGSFQSLQGTFYEGEWVQGKRDGVGLDMTPGKRLRLGEWREDKYLGERIIYTPERIYGIDISRFQHEIGKKKYSINWKNLRITSLGKISKKTVHGTVDYPVSFVYIKATEGTTIKNRYFPADYVASKKNGYRTGAYHFFSIRTTGSEQAKYFLKYAKYAKGDLPPVLDVEPSDKQIQMAGGIDIIFRNVRSWLSAVQTQWGVKPILYISQSFVNKYLSLAPDLKKNYDVWIARYGEYKPDVNLVYWQLSPDGRVSGIQGTVDINVLNDFSLDNY